MNRPRVEKKFVLQINRAVIHVKTGIHIKIFVIKQGNIKDPSRRQGYGGQAPTLPRRSYLERRRVAL